MQNKILVELDSIDSQRMGQFASINNVTVEEAIQMLIEIKLQEIADSAIEDEVLKH